MPINDQEFSAADLQQMTQLGLSEAQVRRQIDIFRNPHAFIRQVPGVPFDPVKTVADLLRPEHQPEHQEK